MTSPRLKIALAVSVALNLFAIGAVAGAVGAQALHAKKVPQSSARGSVNALMRAREVVPEAKRDAYIAGLKRAGEIAQKDFKAAREARIKASNLIAAPTYNQAAIEALLANARAHDVAGRARFETAVVQFAAGLTPEERRILGERLKPGYRAPQANKPTSGQETLSPPPAQPR